MPRNGSGTYTLPQPPFQAGTVISSAAVNSDFSDIATALTGSLPRNGEAGMIGQLKAADGSDAAPSITFTNDVTTGFSHGSSTIDVSIAGVNIGTFSSAGWSGAVNGGGANPIGSVIDYAGLVPPSLWLQCFGQNVSRTTYAKLFVAIGTQYGSGDGSTTFGIPDLRGRSMIGLNNMGGTPSGTLTSTYYSVDPNTLGNKGGGQSTALGTGNLPSYTPSGSNNLGSLTGTIVVQGSLAGSGTAGGTALIGTNNTGAFNNPVTFGGAVNFAGTAQGGSSVAFTLVQPGMVVYKIIYAGA